MTSLFLFFFFKIGVTNNSLKEAGTKPVDSDRLNKCVNNGVSRSKTLLSTEIGTGSSAEDLTGNRAMALATSSGDNDANSQLCKHDARRRQIKRQWCQIRRGRADSFHIFREKDGQTRCPRPNNRPHVSHITYHADWWLT